ncbi:hypothetical protein GCM10010218_60620 [Streptomyces mashuensis]|uniref:Secreted protein n=1 Tax=Streptomyces mashuensis TaxID=33904 RepID=A0A919BAE4_9ACTN|nr:hypothetical protein [Streptomyces mashuensis]GHF71156.1 hypothetical protein GCM10010218_60620 [Streptomyces mashuensis]
MRVLSRGRPLTAACAAALLGAGLICAPGAAAAAVGHTPASLCVTRPPHTGFPPAGGTDIGGSPPRYQSGNSPYLGARFDSCPSTVRAYYGGYAGTGLFHYTYYVMQYTKPGELGWKTINLTIGEHRLLTFHEASNGDWNFKVKACFDATVQGGGQRAFCSPWSPQIYLNAR